MIGREIGKCDGQTNGLTWVGARDACASKKIPTMPMYGVWSWEAGVHNVHIQCSGCETLLNEERMIDWWDKVNISSRGGGLPKPRSHLANGHSTLLHSIVATLHYHRLENYQKKTFIFPTLIRKRKFLRLCQKFKFFQLLSGDFVNYAFKNEYFPEMCNV